jgi:hypothetical protein
MSSMSSIFVPNSASFGRPTGNTSNSSMSSDLDSIRNEFKSLTDYINASPIGPDVEELKKFTEFLKFRIDSLDTRMSVLEKTSNDYMSKMNIMEITMTALSALLKKPAYE